MNSIQIDLMSMKDEKYRLFQCNLMPTVAPEKVIGVRTPLLRVYAKKIFCSGEYEAFLQTLPHEYYEEDNLHAFLIEKILDFDRVIKELDQFLPHVNNWATCDSMNPKIFAKHLPELLCKIREWIASKHAYAVRFGIGMLMKYYLGTAYSTEYPALVASVNSEEYYIKMMVAWYFATALAMQYETVIPFLQEHRLDVWTHNKAIQKAVESNRIPGWTKEYLKTLKRKEHKTNGTSYC